MKRWTLTALLVLAGCSGLGERDRAWVRDEVRRSVRSALAERERPSAYEWVEPQFQMVHEPAHIEGGAFHPAQERSVIIEAGEWRAAPQRKKREIRRER
ncbi:MAG: hypothetical protein HY722_04825 [Planctomycetes bacterium]|nr:hypothetical protein [Planctomycetota bacterium]